MIILIFVIRFESCIKLYNYIMHYSQVFGIADLFKERRVICNCIYKQNQQHQQNQSEEKVIEYDSATSSHRMQVNNGTDNRIC
jgi:hypothetical protein